MPKKRAEDIRREQEAFWSTGEWDPANYIQPDPPITAVEHAAFRAFHVPTTQTYACVLPGELIRLCIEQIEAGLLDPANLVDMLELIVDEYQDLNPMDLQFVDSIADGGVRLFVAGDDDQSIYAFRFASPAGLQEFLTRHPGAGDHVLTGCFRCATAIVNAANALITDYGGYGRIPKILSSLWTTAIPPVEGVVHRWYFTTHTAEAAAIAASCASLLEAGLLPSDILVLLSSRQLFPAIKKEFESNGLPFQPPKEESWTDSDAGRFLLGVLRVVCSQADYVAHRLILGCRRGVGVKTCRDIVERVVANNLNYADVFRQIPPPGGFTGRLRTAIDSTRQVIETVAEWTGNDALGERRESLATLLLDARSAAESAEWEELAATLPDGMTLAELRDYIWTDTEDQRQTQLAGVLERLDMDPPSTPSDSGIRVMTMHGAKGLQGKVVFIPGLEEQVLPSARNAERAGLVLEGARLLYVSITRAQAAVVLSWASRRFIAGASVVHHASRYAAHLGGAFERRTQSLTSAEVATIMQAIQEMSEV